MVCDNIDPKKGVQIMSADQTEPEPMRKDQLNYIKKQISPYYREIRETGF